MKNKNGQSIPQVILIIGLVAVCLYAILSFNLSIANVRNSFVGLGLVEQLNSQIEENYFYEKSTNIGEAASERNLLEAINYAKANKVVNRKCNCGSKCEEYATFITKYSSENGIPNPILLLALMMQESDCTYNAFSGSSTGLMQINLNNCGGYGLPSDKTACKKELIDDQEKNIEVGAKILKEYYNQLKQSCSENKDCKHPMGSNKNCDGKICEADCNEEKMCEYEFDGCEKSNRFYNSWEAALRRYNGWGCGCDTSTLPNTLTPSTDKCELENKETGETKSGTKIYAQDNFVEEVMRRYQILKGNYLEKERTTGMLWWIKKDVSFSVEYLGSPQ
jgi:hypothetical protein